MRLKKQICREHRWPNFLNPEKFSGRPGELVEIEIGVPAGTPAGELYGVEFTLEYPPEALRLESAFDHRTGGLIPPGSSALWHVEPEQDYALQNGVVHFATGGRIAWDDRERPVQVGEGSRPEVEAEIGLALRFVGAVALEAVLREDRANVAEVVDFRRRFVGRIRRRGRRCQGQRNEEKNAADN